jgi:hypothetical protein
MSASDQIATKASPRRKSGGLLVLGFWLGLAIAMVLAFPSFVVLIAGLTPSIVAFFFDRSPDRSASVCMVTLNLAGISPMLRQLWYDGHTLDLALRLISDLSHWTPVLWTVGAAVALLMLVPWILERGIENAAAQRMIELETSLEKLQREWGPEVGAEEVD